MRPQVVSLLIVYLSFSLSACTSQLPTPTPTNPTPPVVPSPTEKLSLVPDTLSPPTQSPIAATPVAASTLETSITHKEPSNRTQYNLSASLNYSLHHLSVEEDIFYTNQSSDPISTLLLVVEPSRYPGVFHLNSIAWGNGQPISEYTRDIGLLRIPLKNSLRPGDALELSLSYDLSLPSPDPSYYGRPVPFGYSARQTNLVDWYPFIPPYVPGQGWLVHKAGPFGEHLVYEVADFAVNLHLSETTPDLILAASAPAEIDGDWHRYHHENARNFAWSASDQYVMSTTTVSSITIFSYYFPGNAEAGKSVLQTTAEALDLYNVLFGPYPRQSLTVIEADFLDGMEYDGLYFLSKGFYNLYSGEPTDYLTAIAAHETAHQWWYSSIGNDQALEPWLDEALCTYSERLFYEYLYPQGLDWWWTYRVHYYQPNGWVDGNIYNPEGYRAYRDAVYLNGALFLEDLRVLVGDTVFFDFINAYAHELAYKIATADDFFRLLEDISQTDITPLLDKYFQNR